MKRELVHTADHSPTLFVAELDEHYHSVHGALQESKHVFIEAGWRLFEEAPGLRILEVGFGTGLNALLTSLKAGEKGQVVHYLGLEKYPLKAEEWQHLDYGSLINEKKASANFKALHECAWNEWQEPLEDFHLRKEAVDLLAVKLPETYFNLIFFDAFAPSAQAYLWSVEVFEKMYQCLEEGGVLVTYCVKGSVRRNMQAAGFTVEKIPGPPGKREMARAFKS